MLATERDHEYSTASLHLAAFLLFVLGNESHVATYRLGEDKRSKFMFSFYDRTDRCNDLADEFFSQEGAAVQSARGLLVSFQAIKQTIRLADRSPDGIWMRSTACVGEP